MVESRIISARLGFIVGEGVQKGQNKLKLIFEFTLKKLTLL